MNAYLRAENLLFSALEDGLRAPTFRQLHERDTQVAP